MEDENWTVVARRRTFKLRSSVPENSSLDSSKPRARKIRSLQARPEDRECDEALLLHKMERSMARVQESAFFKMLLDQLQSSPVLHHLHRAASAPRVDVLDAHLSVSDEDKMLANLGSHVFAHPFICNSEDITLQIRSSTEDSMLQCVCTLLRVPREKTQNEVICKASIDVAKACSGTNYSMECKCLLEVSNGMHGKEMKRVCRCTNIAYSATHIESSKGLIGIDGIEVCKHLTMMQRPYHQISEEPWCLQVVVYGLGSIADSEISRCQFALILLLKQRFAWVGDVEVYDPVLSQSECKVIADMGCLPIAENEEGRRRVLRPTLFYMPHCEAWLYDNVLQANWVLHRLGQLVILGNSFRDYQERWASSIGGTSKPLFYVKQYQQVAQEIPLKATSSLDLPGFNNMSWHFYPLLDKSNCVLVE